MKVIKSNVIEIKQGDTLEDMFRHIEYCGRICYKSNDRITENSYENFIKNLIKSKHKSVLEHGAVYLTIPFEEAVEMSFAEYTLDDNYVYITTNLREIYKNNLEYYLKYFKKTPLHKERVSFLITCSRGISHQIVRHRAFSLSQESTRYCNYSKNKFNNEITYIEPYWYKDSSRFAKMIFEENIEFCENNYFQLLEEGLSPEKAREVLPHSLKTELVITGFVSDFIGNEKELEGFLPLRTKSNAHEDIRIIANKILELINNKINK